MKQRRKHSSQAHRRRTQQQPAAAPSTSGRRRASAATRLLPWAPGTLLVVLAALLAYRFTRLQAQRRAQLQAEHDLLSAEPSTAFCNRERLPHVCAHGGATDAAPPNTRAAFAAAVAAGVDCVEVDVSLTADSQLVALHDRDLQQLMRGTRPDAKVHQQTLRELQQLAWPSGGHVLTAADALSATAPHVQLLIVDVKTAPGSRRVLAPDGRSHVSEAAFMLPELLRLLRQLNRTQHSLVWGKSDEVALLVKQAAPGQLAGYTVMFSPGSEFEQPLRLEEAEVAAVYHGMLNASLMEGLRQAGKTVIAWTPDSPAELRRMLELGVDGCVTNQHALMQRALQAWAGRCRRAQ